MRRGRVFAPEFRNGWQEWFRWASEMAGMEVLPSTELLEDGTGLVIWTEEGDAIYADVL